jgi:hypothetical protein
VQKNLFPNNEIVSVFSRICIFSISTFSYFSLTL